MIPLSKIQVSPVKEKQFEKKHITCVEELATFFPRKYQDFRTKKKIKGPVDLLVDVLTTRPKRR